MNRNEDATINSSAVDDAAVERACVEAAEFLGYRVETDCAASGTVLVDETSGETRAFETRGALTTILCLELMEAAGLRNGQSQPN